MTVQPTTVPDASPALWRPCTPTSPARRRWLVGVQLEDVTGAAAAGERAGHDRGPLPELAAQDFSHRGRPGRRRALAAWPPRCAPSAAGRRRRRHRRAARRWRPRASRSPPTACSSTRAALRRRDRGRALPAPAGHQPPVQLALPARAAGQHARLRHHRPRRAQPRGGRRARVRAPVPALRRTAWARCWTWCPTTWACWKPTTPGGWTCWSTARRRRMPDFDIEWAPAPRPRCAAGCCCRCWATTTARSSSPARSSCTSIAETASSGCATGTTASRSTRRPIPTSWRAARAARARRQRERQPRGGRVGAGVVRAPAGATARTTTKRRARVRDSRHLQAQPGAAGGRHDWLAHWIDSCVQRLNGQPATRQLRPARQADGAQAYRLADWHVASDDVNYRRFFDVNTLAGAAHGTPGGVRGHACARCCTGCRTATWTACASTTPTACPIRSSTSTGCRRASRGRPRWRGRAARAVPGGREDPGRARAPAAPLAGARRHRLPLRQPGQRPVRRHPPESRCWTAPTGSSPTSTTTSARSPTSASG
jgi:hypothetical protein